MKYTLFELVSADNIDILFNTHVQLGSKWVRNGVQGKVASEWNAHLK